MTNESVKTRLAEILSLEMDMCENGLWIGNISNSDADHLVKLGLVELDRVPEYDENSNILGVDSFWILTSWGAEVALALKS